MLSGATCKGLYKHLVQQTGQSDASIRKNCACVNAYAIVKQQTRPFVLIPATHFFLCLSKNQHNGDCCLSYLAY